MTARSIVSTIAYVLCREQADRQASPTAALGIRPESHELLPIRWCGRIDQHEPARET
jgi:hypothetical protein